MENGKQPAYPTQGQNTSCWDTISGLTKREYFAGLAMQGILSSPNRWLTDDKEIECNPEQVAGMSLEYADALLKALEKKIE